nr:MAG TPA: hypothetical protein [Caudoviricetes sp.]DAU06791.1 MAG TPA: hypothetical protein [Caudoviricetes sp.]
MIRTEIQAFISGISFLIGRSREVSLMLPNRITF